MIKIKYFLPFLLFGLLVAQDNVDEPPAFSDFQISSERYLTNSDGSIMMNINIWGHVNSPGSHLVYDGIDFATLLSKVGGPIDGANLKNVRIYREIPDVNGSLVYHIDLNEFIQTRDRSKFIKIKPKSCLDKLIHF